MRVLHINATSHTGGAARAMQRLHKALIAEDHHSQFLVGRSKSPEDPLVHLIWDEVEKFRSLPGSLKSRIGNTIEHYLGIHPWANRPTLKITRTDIYQWADIIDLRNLFGGFFNLWSLPDLSESKPVVWRLPDLWALTGHCAYPYDCQRWKTGCYDCPLLTEEGRRIVEPSPTVWDGTRRVWRAKKNIYQQSKLHVIVTTRWMKRQVEQSILGNALSINVISNGVDLDVYRPIPREQARRQLDLPADADILLWAAGSKGNYRKGYQLVVDALTSIQSEKKDPPWLVTMGGDRGWEGDEPLRNIKDFGYVRDSEKQALIYSAADVFICSTLADAQPQTALESLACGTPVIAFPVGPMPDLISEGKTGWIAPAADLQGLLTAFGRINQERLNRAEIRRHCRQQAEEKYHLAVQTEKYIRLYEHILEEQNTLPGGNRKIMKS